MHHFDTVRNLAVVALILVVLVSCATVREVKSVDSEAESGDDISFLNGTVWVSEVQRADLVAYKTYAINDGKLKFWVRMGDAIDEHSGLGTVVLEGNRIKFISSDGGVSVGILEEDRIVFDNNEIYNKVE